MGFSHNGIDFEFKGVHGPHKEAWATDNSRIDTQYVVPWSERWAARDALLGTAEVVPGLVPFISRTMPHVYPGTGLIARAVPSIEGEKGSEDQDSDKGGPPRYDRAVLNVIYEAVSYDCLTDAEVIGEDDVPDESLLLRWVTVRESPATQFFSTKPGAWKWSEGTNSGKEVHTDIPLRIPKTEITIIWHQVPIAAYPAVLYRESIGKTNSDVFAGRAAQTLELVSASPEHIRLPSGVQERAVNIALKMLHYPKGVNRFPDPRDDNAFRAVVGRGGTAPFTPMAFASLMRPPA